jgi:hypothetical protein
MRCNTVSLPRCAMPCHVVDTTEATLLAFDLFHPLIAPLVSCTNVQVDWFMSAEQEASTEALTHRWDPSGQAAVTRLEAFLQQVGIT